MNWQELPDRKLVELCLEGNEDAWVELQRRYHRMITGVLAKTIRPWFLPTHSVLQDRYQDVLLKICNNECRALRELEWRHEGALRGLLQVTASTVAQDYLRYWLAQIRDITKMDSLEDPSVMVPEQKGFCQDVEQKILLQELVRCLQKVIQSEPDCTRDLAMFLLFYGCKVTATDMARLYRLNIRKVENIVARLSRLARSHCL
jgi:hypothetical protein